MLEKVNEFIEKEFHGTRRKRPWKTSVEFQIGGATVNVLLHGFQVGVYTNAGQNPELVDRIGDRFDALLKTGSLDDLFLPMN